MNREQDKRLSKLLALAQQGEREAYACFLREIAIVLRGFLASRAPNRNEIEDILQDTLLAIHRARHSYTPGRPLGPWVYAICENRAIDYARKLQRNRRFTQEWRQETENREQSGAKTEDALQADEVLAALEKLPLKQRLIINLLKLQGQSVSSIAIKTGMSEAAVKVTAFRGYEKIRKTLGVKNED